MSWFRCGGGGGITSDEVTATKANVLAGTTALTSDSNDEVATGTMVNNGAVSQSLAINGTYTIPAGYHNGSGKVTQSITTKGAATYTPSTSNQTISAGQYLSGAQTIAGDADLVAANIRKGVNIFGVSGTWYGNKAAISAKYARNYDGSTGTTTASFTMPSNGIVYYGGMAYGYNSSTRGTLRIYKNGTQVDERDLTGAFTIRDSMFNQSFSANSGDVISVEATITSGYGSCDIQAVIVY